MYEQLFPILSHRSTLPPYCKYMFYFNLNNFHIFVKMFYIRGFLLNYIFQNNLFALKNERIFQVPDFYCDYSRQLI